MSGGLLSLTRHTPTRYSVRVSWPILDETDAYCEYSLQQTANGQVWALARMNDALGLQLKVFASMKEAINYCLEVFGC